MRRFQRVSAICFLVAACGGPSTGEDAGTRDGGERIVAMSVGFTSTRDVLVAGACSGSVNFGGGRPHRRPARRTSCGSIPR